MSWSPAHVATIGTRDRAAITDIRFRVKDDATGEHVRFHVNGIAAVNEPAAAFPHGLVTFTFDDNHASMVAEGLPTLAAHGFPATAYVIADRVDRPGRASLAELVTLQAQHSWEIAAHAYADDHHAARFTNLPPGVLEDDIVDMRAWLITHGFTGYDHCAYPGGEFTGGAGTDVLGFARTYFASCRTIFQGHRENYLPADSHKLRVFYVTSGVSLASALAAVDRAVAHREWVILVFHKLVPVPSLSTEWAIADFQALVAHVAAAQVPVVTVGSALSASSP